MDKSVHVAFGTPRLRNATQSSGQRANETVARPNPDGTLGATAKPEPSTETGQAANIPGTPTRPSDMGPSQGPVRNQPAKGKPVGDMPRAARPGGSTPARGRSL